MDFIKELDEGNYTGKLLKTVTSDNFIISTTQYLQSKCESRLHSHKNPHICLLYQGSDFESRENSISYERKTGDIFFYDSGEPHRIINTTKNSKNINIELRNSIYLKKNISRNNIRNSIENNIDTNLLSLKILKEIHLNDDFTSLSLETLCFELLDCSNKVYSSFKPDWIYLIKDFLNDNWQAKFSLSELSIVASVHPVTISKNFQKYFFCSYGEYVRKLKIRKSITMIKNSKMPLTEIAYACGFSDQSHFIRNFKNLTGFLPKHFQRI